MSGVLIDFLFQSTLPARGSDSRAFVPVSASLRFQSTLPARGSDAPCRVLRLSLWRISIHAPRKGERPKVTVSTGTATAYFNPRSPQGERPYPYAAYIAARAISIHAPRKGERLVLRRLLAADVNFNPRSPQGGATIPCKNNRRHGRISIHAPHEGERHRP